MVTDKCCARCLGSDGSSWRQTVGRMALSMLQCKASRQPTSMPAQPSANSTWVSTLKYRATPGRPTLSREK